MGSVPTLVRSGRGSGVTIDIDVTGARTLFILGNQNSNPLVCSNPAVIMVARDANSRRTTVWNIPEGLTGIVTFTATVSRLWGYSLIDWCCSIGAGLFAASNTTTEMPQAEMPLGFPSIMATYYSSNNSADWDPVPAGHTALETITTQLVEPSWNLIYSNAPAPVGWFVSPWMNRGKPAVARVESTVSVMISEFPVKFENFKDTFDTEVNFSVWGGWGSYGWDSSQRLAMHETQTASQYSGATTTAKFTLKESSIFWTMEALQPPQASRESTFSLLQDANNGVWTVLLDNPLLIFYRSKVAGVGTEFTVPYDPVLHLYHRIRETAGTIYFETSPEGMTWTVQWTQPTGFDISNLYIEMSGGHWTTVVGDLGTFYVDNINKLPGAPPVTGGRPDVFTGAWETKPSMWWNGNAWVEVPWRRWNGTIWELV